MKKFFLVFIIVGGVLWVGGYFLYTFYFPKFVAQAIISENKPTYLPKRIMNKIDEIRAPINKSTENLLREFQKANVPMTKVYEAIDETSEEDAYALLDEFNHSNLKTSNEAFDIVKKHIHADFDVEQFRKPFNENVDPKMIKRLMRYANMNRQMNEVDIKTAKEVAKQILMEKQKEIQNNTN
jgi:hypothetical protein